MRMEMKLKSTKSTMDRAERTFSQFATFEESQSHIMAFFHSISVSLPFRFESRSPSLMALLQESQEAQDDLKA